MDDLALERESVTHRLLFAPGSLRELCAANGVDPAAILAEDDLTCYQIGKRYLEHAAAGGKRDSVGWLAGGKRDNVAEGYMADLVDDVRSGTGREHSQRPRCAYLALRRFRWSPSMI